MTPWLVRLLHAADQNPLVYMNRGFQNKGTRLDLEQLVVIFAVLLAVVLVIWLVSKIGERIQRREPYQSTVWLFVELCRAHRLRFQEGWLLWQVARNRHLQPAARLFVEPRSLDVEGLNPRLQQRAAELAALRDRLFGESSVEGQGQ